MNGFDKLRLRAGVGVMGALAGVCGVSRSARAAVTPTPLNIVSAGVRWSQIKNSNTGPPTFGNGFGVTSGGILTASGRNDAFDGAFMCRVNGVTYINPGGNVDLSAVAGGRKVTSNPASVGSLSVRMTLYASGSLPVMRGICSVTNPTGAPIAVTLLTGMNHGSDNQTFIRNSSSGDTVVDSADHWYVSSDANPTTGDPVVAVGRFGGTASTSPTLVQTPGTPLPPGSNDNLVDRYVFTVAAGQTASVMQLASAHPDIAPANALAPSFDNTTTLQSAGLLADLTPTELVQIINYGPAPVPQTVPTLTGGGARTLALLLGAVALLHAVRRRRKGAVKRE